SALAAKPLSTVAIDDSTPRETDCSGSPKEPAICPMVFLSSMPSNVLNTESDIVLFLSCSPPTTGRVSSCDRVNNSRINPKSGSRSQLLDHILLKASMSTANRSFNLVGYLLEGLPFRPMFRV